jgi:hypothetical protein
MSVPGGIGGGGSGQYGREYVPPPPPATSRRSPWLYVALGCGLFTVLLVGGCVAFISIAGNKLAQEMKKPLDKAALQREMADVPTYPGAKIDEKSTKAAGAVFGFMKGMMKKGQSMTFAAYTTPDDDAKVLAWYDKAMTAAGYQRAKGTAKSGNVEEQRMYRKGDVIVMVQIPGGASTASFHLMRMQGMDEKEAGGLTKGGTDDGE